MSRPASFYSRFGEDTLSFESLGDGAAVRTMKKYKCLHVGTGEASRIKGTIAHGTKCYICDYDRKHGGSQVEYAKAYKVAAERPRINLKAITLGLSGRTLRANKPASDAAKPTPEAPKKVRKTYKVTITEVDDVDSYIANGTAATPGLCYLNLFPEEVHAEVKARLGSYPTVRSVRVALTITGAVVPCNFVTNDKDASRSVVGHVEPFRRYDKKRAAIAMKLFWFTFSGDMVLGDLSLLGQAFGRFATAMIPERQQARAQHRLPKDRVHISASARRAITRGQRFVDPEAAFFDLMEMNLYREISDAVDSYNANLEVPVTIGGDGECWKKLYRREDETWESDRTSAMSLREFTQWICESLAFFPDQEESHILVLEDGIDWHLEAVSDKPFDNSETPLQFVMRVAPDLAPFTTEEGYMMTFEDPDCFNSSSFSSVASAVTIGSSWRDSGYASFQRGSTSAYRQSTAFVSAANDLPALNHYSDSGAWASTSRLRSNISSLTRRSGFRQKTSVHGDVARPFEANPFAYVTPARRGISLNAASAIVSAKVLLGGDALGGETYAENAAIASEALGKAYYTTSVPPASKTFRKLVLALGVPLNYKPSIEAHPAAATVRRAHTWSMHQRVVDGTIGMVSPSYTEWHLNPYAFAWYPDCDPTDASRFTRPCNECHHHECRIKIEAEQTGRVIHGDLSAAIATFSHARVDYLWMVNIEPNIPSHDILRLMSCANIKNGLSAFSIDPRVVYQHDVTDELLGQRHVHRGSDVISSFADSGAYTAPFANVRDLFAPISSSYGSLRRTLVSRAGSGILCELQHSSGITNSGLNPLHPTHYLIPVPHPTYSIQYLSVEREGFDRLLQLFRTTATRDLNAARIQLRQSNVTYSVSGSQLTPRLVVSATDSELLSVWMVAYSAMCDVIAANATEETQRHMTESAKSTTITGALYQKIMATATAASPLAGSTSAIRAWIQALQVDGKYQTLDAISEHAYQEVYGKPIDVESIFGNLASMLPGQATFQRIKNRFVSFTRSAWKGTFTAAAVLAEAFILAREFGIQSFCVALEIAHSIARAIGYQTDIFRRLQVWFDSIHRPAGKILSDMIDAQGMPFQAAVIYIVESFVSNWNVDPEVERIIMEERARFFDDAPEPPYTRFVLEIKAILRATNSRTASFSRCHQLISCISDRLSLCPIESKERLLELQRSIKEVMNEIANEPAEKPIVTASHYSLSAGTPTPAPIPMHQVFTTRHRRGHVPDDQELDERQMPIQIAFNERRIIEVDDTDGSMTRQPMPNPAIRRTIERLPNAGPDEVSFEPIHQMMRESPIAPFMHADADQAIENRIPEVLPFSPDHLGTETVRRAIFAAAAGGGLTNDFVDDDDIIAWRDRNLAAPNQLPAVARAFRYLTRERLDARGTLRYVAHIQGLAMGGKSKGVRSWISSDDMVVTSSNELKKQWEEELGHLDPTKRASVYTQHTALSAECKRFVIVDEAFTFPPSHLQALRKKRTGTGFITIGDEMQIGSVLEPAEGQWNPRDSPPLLTLLTPVSFCPLDAMYIYLRLNPGQLEHTRFFCGSSIARGLLYDISDDYVLTSPTDLSINGLQASKAHMRAIGLSTSITAHESQGSRSEYTFVHSQVVNGVDPDYAWLSGSNAHLGVLITRARKGTVFIVPRARTLHDLNIFDHNLINGPSVDDVYTLHSGTIFDLVDPTNQTDLVVEHLFDPVLPPSTTKELTYDAQLTAGAIIDLESSSAVATEWIHAEVDLSRVQKAVLDDVNKPTTLRETFVATGSQIPHNGVIQADLRLTRPSKVTAPARGIVPRIVNKIFSRVIDKDKFFSHLHASRPIINRMDRDKLLKMSEANLTRGSLLGRFFPKNELAKKVSTIGLGNAFKTLSVTAQSEPQLAMFMETSDVLGRAWNFSMRPGRFSPVGYSRHEINRVLDSDRWSWELDISAQDSSHTAVHVAVFAEFMGMVADKVGMAEFAEEVRCRRQIADHNAKFMFEMGTGLGSGDAWTLIANCIMAVSTLASRFNLPPEFRMMQVGDDTTLDRKLTPLRPPLLGSERVGIKKSSNPDHPSFTSYQLQAPDTVLPVRLRFLCKMAFVKRNADQHTAYQCEMLNIKHNLARIGVSAYAEALAHANGSDSMVVENILIAALHVEATAYENLPKHLVVENMPSNIQILSRDGGCFGFAAAHAATRPDDAVNLLHQYRHAVPLETAVTVCLEHRIPYAILHEPFADSPRMREKLSGMLRASGHEALVVLFPTHAVCVKYASRTLRANGDEAVFIRNEDLHNLDDDFV